MLNASQKATICKQHNLTEEYINLNNSKEALICCTCIDQYFGIQSISKTDQAHQQSIKDLMSKSKLRKQTSTKFLQLLHQKGTLINDAFDEIIFQVRCQLESIKDIISNHLDEAQMIRQYLDKSLKDNVNLSKKIEEQCELLKNELCIAQLTELLEKLNSINLNLEQVEEVKEIPKQEDAQLLPQANIIETNQQQKKVLRYQYKLLENFSKYFWVLKENQWIQEQKIETQSNIISLSLKDSSNELLCCSDNQVIFVLNKKESQWIIKQKIELLVEGFGVCYLNDNNFIFQPSDCNQLIFFSQDIVKQQFKQTNTLKLNDDENDYDGSFFPIHFIRQKGILLAKNGKYLFILRELANMEFVLDQQILFNSYIIYGSISNDGINLLTWDNSTKEYQIRILVEEQ